ncbi:hypothetical protein ACSBR1_015923 [Camellia fascicularis]
MNRAPDFWTKTEDAVQRAYRTTDTSILDKSLELGKGGSTAVTAILIDCQKLVVANVGDSRAVACKNGVAKQLSVDHGPSKERTYIEDRGGFVSNFPGDVPRVGQLAVARAFGDKSLKKHLSSEPDIERYELLEECLNDGTPEVRDAAFSALAAVAKLVGMRPLEKSLEKLDDIRKKKLSEMIGGSGAGSVGSISVQTSSGSISSAAPTSKKGGAVKSGVNKKGDAVGQLKTSKPAEPEDVELPDGELCMVEKLFIHYVVRSYLGLKAYFPFVTVLAKVTQQSMLLRVQGVKSPEYVDDAKVDGHEYDYLKFLSLEASLGIRHLHDFNQTLLGKWLWRFTTENNVYRGESYILFMGLRWGLDLRALKLILSWSLEGDKEREGGKILIDICALPLRTRRRIEHWKDIWCKDTSLMRTFLELYHIVDDKEALV